VSSTPVGNTSITKFDVMIIGSGAGGAPVAHVLCAQGLNVLVIEAGTNRFDHLDDATQQPVPRLGNDEIGVSVRNAIVPNALVEPRSWRNTEKDGDRTFVGDVNTLPKTVGGGGVHADLKMPRFTVDDFHLGTLLGAVSGASFADWPVDYDMLEPFYAWGEKLLGVQGVVGANPFESKRSGPFPMPPGNVMYAATKFIDGCKKLGYTAFPYPTAVNSQPYDGRPACVDCGFCSGYVCPSNAKGSPLVTMMRKALLTGKCLLLPETRAVRLVMNGTKDTVTGVECIGPDGKRVTYSADRYVLAASPIEDARLLFLSDPGGAGIGNSSDQVGRNLTFHFQTNAVAIFEERIHGHRGRTVSHGFADFRGKANDPAHPLGGIVEISGSEFPIGEANYYARFMNIQGTFKGSTLKKLLRQSPGRDRIVALAMQAEDAPQPTNRIDLDPAIKDLDGLPVARVTYQNHDFESNARKFYEPKILELIQASGARWGAIAPKDDIPGSAHIMGTLRFGNDPKTSVCDSNGKFHDVTNLYASDGALFPTSAGWNPTMTIVALALWVGASMVFPGSPQKAIPT
jgi:choline dehydrogenase-like flavoprotein